MTRQSRGKWLKWTKWTKKKYKRQDKMARAEKENMTQEEKMQKQYDRLINARNYHYDNLNKWLMTFYVILGALFVAFYTIHSRKPELGVEIIVAMVGYIVSIAALLSGKGYYYWETNWIMLVHDFERRHIEPQEDRVYSVFANMSANNSICCPTKGANISTSKVALAITAFISWLWGTIMIYFILKWLSCPCLEKCECMKALLAGLGSYPMTRGLVWLGGKLFPSDMKPLDDLQIH
jgi:hypothetical protein